MSSYKKFRSIFLILYMKTNLQTILWSFGCCDCS